MNLITYFEGLNFVNPQHLALLKQSVEEFNQWRSQNWTMKPDLSGADLRGANLFQANLSDANLAGADLRGANMVNVEARSADFEQADLAGAQMQGANLAMSNMTRTNFQQANLMGASLADSCLVEANFSQANCMAAKFSSSNLLRSIFYDAKVKGAKFDSTNINEAHIYAEQFMEAEIPLEIMGTLEGKKRRGKRFALAFISFSIVFIIGFFLFFWIFTAQEPGAFNTRLRSAIHLELGNLCSYMGLWDQVIRNLEVTLRYDQRNERAHNLIADAYRNQGDFRNAVKHYRIYVDLVGSDTMKARAAKEFLYKHKRLEREYREAEEKRKKKEEEAKKKESGKK